MEDNNTPSAVSQAPQVDPAIERERRKTVVIASVFGILFLVLIILAIVFLLTTSGETTGKIRDIFIIFMALESLLIGVALIVLIVQISRLVNLLQNEIQPMLEATNETINNLRGTSEFLGENLVEPVIKLNSYLAGLRRLLDMIGLKQK
jgi:NADH:ubiquinone oxidoreductase subunit K